MYDKYQDLVRCSWTRKGATYFLPLLVRCATVTVELTPLPNGGLV